MAGVCIWFTGRSGAGKSTVTNALVPLLESAGQTVSVLDVVPELGKKWCEWSSREKLLRKAVVAGEIVKHGGVAICVTVSARREVREQARARIGPESFVEVFVDVPERVSRERKALRGRRPSLRKLAKRVVRGVLNRVRGEKRPSFEIPADPDVRIDTTRQSPAESARQILAVLADRGLLEGETAGSGGSGS